MAKDRRSRITVLKDQFKAEYDKITQEIKKLEGQRDGRTQALALIENSTPAKVKAGAGH